jgi:DNA-binding CsgD family transcriptional regulator
MVGAHARLAIGLPIAGDGPSAVLAGWAGAPIEWEAVVAASEGRHEDAVAAFVRAADTWRGQDVRGEARCRWAAGEAARQADLPSAVELLRAAESVADRTQQRPLAAGVRRSMRTLGVHRSAPRAHAPSGLSQREEEVLGLVGTGSTSAEIGASLGIAVSTVDSLVRSAVVKLGAANRRAAAARLREMRRGA